MDVIKVPYTQIGEDRYRPYQEIALFYNNKHSPKTLALMDSGADQIVIPYSLGVNINLPHPADDTELKAGKGVGGGISFVERNCRIYIPDYVKRTVYGFEVVVMWVYPSKELRERQNKSIKDFVEFQKLKEQCKDGTDLSNYFDKQMENCVNEIKQINSICETDTLLGRNFFNNFNYIQFFQRDSNTENTCSFHYQIKPRKIINTIPMT